jgi:H+/gluconate symporter-like permease
MGGKCPRCGSADVLDGSGQRATDAEFDHFHASSEPDPEYTWLANPPAVPFGTHLRTGAARAVPVTVAAGYLQHRQSGRYRAQQDSAAHRSELKPDAVTRSRLGSADAYDDL